MKIAIIIAGMNVPGGIERVVSIQANYWVSVSGFEVCLLTHLDKKGESFYSLDNRVRNVYIGDLPVYRLYDHLPCLYVLRTIRKRIAQYREVLKKENPDIILTMMHGSENYYLNYCSCRIPVIGINHITLDLRRGCFERNWLKKWFKKVSYYYQMTQFRKYDKIVALSTTDCELLKNCGCDSVYIPNPRTFDVVNTTGSAHREKTIIMVGRFDYHKGQDRLIEIWKDLAPRNPEWKLVLVGGGDFQTIIRKMIYEYHIEKQTEIVSNVNNISDYYIRSSIFALTSRTESFGMVILEAMSYRLPCIVYDCENGPRDIIKNGVNGYLIPDGDSEVFKSKLQILINDVNLRYSFVEKSSNTLDNYSVEVVMKSWNNLCEQTIREYETKRN